MVTPMTTATAERTQCAQYIYTQATMGTVRCSRLGTHYVPSGAKMVCTQHARSYDRKA